MVARMRALPADPAVARPRARTDRARAPGRLLLCVDDSITIVRYVQRVAALRPGVEVVAASLGASGVEMAVKHRPDLILLDLNLPDASGLEVLRRLKAGPETGSIPVIMLRGDADESHMRRLVEAGARDYLTKPIGVDELLAVLDRSCRRPHGCALAA